MPTQSGPPWSRRLSYGAHTLMIIPRSIGQIGKIRTEKKLRARAIIGQGQPWLVPISGIAWTATRLIVCTLCSGSAPVMTCTASASRIILIPPRNTDRYGTAIRRKPVEAFRINHPSANHHRRRHHWHHLQCQRVAHVPPVEAPEVVGVEASQARKID